MRLQTSINLASQMRENYFPFFLDGFFFMLELVFHLEVEKKMFH